MESFAIRCMREEDITMLSNAFIRQGWADRNEVLKGYYADQGLGKRKVWIGDIGGSAVGYVTLLPRTAEGPFLEKGWPEIVDFNVLISYQCRGIGSALMDAAEQAAAKLAAVVTLGVGLHSGYGAAQRMYIRRGYQFDGSGVWFCGKPLAPYSTCCNDDDLVLYLSKKL